MVDTVCELQAKDAGVTPQEAASAINQTKQVDPATASAANSAYKVVYHSA